MAGGLTKICERRLARIKERLLAQQPTTKDDEAIFFGCIGLTLPPDRNEALDRIDECFKVVGKAPSPPKG